MDSFFRTTESEDGKEIVEWIAKQDWCTGNVGMNGVSYPGFTANFAALLSAPHLKAIVPVCGTSDKYQSLYPNGNPRIFFPGYINAFRMAFDLFRLNIAILGVGGPRCGRSTWRRTSRSS